MKLKIAWKFIALAPLEVCRRTAFGFPAGNKISQLIADCILYRRGFKISQDFLIKRMRALRGPNAARGFPGLIVAPI